MFFDEVTETFSNLSQFPTEVTDTDLKTLERCVVLVYDSSSAATRVDEARLHMFCHEQRPYDSIPPTQTDQREHAKRAAYQAGVTWGQATAYLCRSRYRQSIWLRLDENKRDVEGVLDQTTAHRVKLPGTDHIFVQERLHQKVQMPSFWTCLYNTLQLGVSAVEL